MGIFLSGATGDLLPSFANNGLFLWFSLLVSTAAAGDLDLSLSRANKGFLLSSSSIGVFSEPTLALKVSKSQNVLLVSSNLPKKPRESF